MDFRILGPIEALDEGREVALGGSKQRALLAVLLLHANETLSTDRLIDELWGESPPATASKTVQVHISRLRKTLATPAGNGEAGMVVTHEHGYQLEVDPERLDAHRFERLLGEGRGELAAGRAERAASVLEGALDLWRGPPLADLAYEPFAQREIARLDELRVAASEQLIEAKLALGDHAEVVGELEALIAEHPYRERLHAQLMLALYRCDRQADALQAYQDARRRLVEELGIEPGERLRDLEQAILEQDQALAFVERPERAGPRGAAPSAPSAIVGRRRELDALQGGLEQALAGRGGLFLIAGEAGIGKSRLLDELARQARERGAQVLWGRCWEAGGAPAYWPWVQSLRAHVGDRDRRALRGELGAGVGELATILPELREAFPGLPEPPSLDPESARFRLFEAVGAFLEAAARARPLVLVLDDLHAADEPSLLLLQFVAGQLGKAPVFIAGAYRDIELAPNTPLASLVAELARERVSQSLTLTGLSEAEVGSLIEADVGVRPQARSVAAIHHGTEGNPLFVGEVVRLLSSEGRLAEVSEAPAEVLPIPPGVREVIDRRLRHLSQDCRGILTLAAVLGREFDFRGLSHVSDRSEEELMDALDEALRANVLSELPGAPERLRFAHMLIRDTLYGELGGPRRLRLHREVGEALEALYGSDREPHLAELAHHFVAGDSPKAVEYARAAGDRAVNLFAYEEAVRLYGMALEVLRPGGAATDRARCELLLALADAEGRAGDDPGAKSNFLRAAELARAAELPELLAHAAVGYGGRFVWTRAATDPRLVPLLEDALAAWGEQDTVRVQLLSRLAAALRGDPTRERRERVCDEAVQAARRIGDPATLAYALDAAEAALYSPRTAERRLHEAGEIVSLAGRIGDNERLFDGHEHAFWSSWELGDLDRRAAELVYMKQVAEELRQPAQLWSAAAAQAVLALAQGRFREAEELIERAATVGERALSWNAAVSRRLQEFVLRREENRLEGFDTEVRDFEHEFPSPLMQRSVLAYVCARLEQSAEAAAALDDLTRVDLADWHHDEEWLVSICLLAETCTIIGDRERAEPLYELLLPYASLNAVAVPEVALDSTSRPLGILATLLGRYEDAERHFEEALRMNTRMGARPWVAHTERDYARMLAARGGPGDRERALELAVRALEGYRGLGMDSYAGEAARLQSGLGAAPAG